MYKRIIGILILMICVSGCDSQDTNVLNDYSKTHLERADWSDDVKTALNQFVDEYGISSKNYNKNSYAVFDFDNTSSIFDVTLLNMYYQASHMCYEVKPEDFKRVLTFKNVDLSYDLNDFGYENVTLGDFLDDLCDDYKILYDSYGPFTYKGIDDEKLDALHNDENWNDFFIKKYKYYDFMFKCGYLRESCEVVPYFYYDMTKDQVRDMIKRCLNYYKDKDTSEVTISSKKENVKAPCKELKFITGISVTENIKELYRVLKENGIDVWICSAACEDAVYAACDVFGLASYVKGIIGLRNSCTNGKYTSETSLYTYMEGKVDAINDICKPIYGSYPLAAFGDSTGDYDMMTEFPSLKIAVVMNCLYDENDGGSLLAEKAIYQKNTLKYDLATANANGDTLYVLQGRDENGLRSFRNSNKSIKFGEKEEKLFNEK